MRVAAVVVLVASLSACKRSEPAIRADAATADATSDASPRDASDARACATLGGPCCADPRSGELTCGGVPLGCAGAVCTCVAQATAIYDVTPVVRRLNGSVWVARDRVHYSEITGPKGSLSATDLAVSGSTAYGTGVGCVVLADGDVQCFPLEDALIDPTPLGAGLAPGAPQATQAVQTSDGGALVDARQISGTMNGGATAFCAVTSQGGIWCWGNGSTGIFGRGDTSDAPVARPVLVAPGVPFSDALEVRLGYDSACARKTDGTVWCWGGDAFGQTGAPAPDAGTATTLFPAGPIALPSPATRLAANPGNTHCAIVDDGAVWCWGANASAQAGAPASASAPPTRVTMSEGGAPLANVVDLAPDHGMQAMCAKTVAGELFCWGHPFAPAGAADATSPYPIVIPFGGDVRAPLRGPLSSFGGRDGSLVYVAPDGSLTLGAGGLPFAAQPSCDAASGVAP